MIVSQKTGRAYCYQPDRLYLRAGSDIALLGDAQYQLAAPAIQQNDEFYLSAEDMRRIAATLQLAPPDGDEPVAVMQYFGLHPDIPMFHVKDVLAVGLDGTQPDIPKKGMRKLLWTMSKKHLGELHLALWLPETGRINSYRLYVPTGWHTAAHKKMLVCLHGSASNENVYFTRSQGKLSYLAEKHGYLVLAPNSLVLPSNFGGPIPPSGQFPAPRFTDAQGNPQYYSEADLAENALAERCVMQLMQDVIREYQVDSDRIALTGNSMGAIGAFYLGGKYDCFRALCPSGALPEPTVADWSIYGQKPILYIAGTEDHNGFEKMTKDCAYIKAQGVNITLLAVGGGAHADAWVWELPDIFAFFDRTLS